MFYSNSAPTFSLDNFEGPLELLLYLIQKEEIDICLIALKSLTGQFRDALDSMPEVEVYSETLALAATLLLVKSQKLLPQEERELDGEEEQRVEILQSLIEYCQLKEAAKALSIREEEQKGQFVRATSPFQRELGTGLEEVGIDHLKTLIADMLKRTAHDPKRVIQGEEWEISHKLEWLRDILRARQKITFAELFQEDKSRVELIVQFLALLEMMKHQEAKLIMENGAAVIHSS